MGSGKGRQKRVNAAAKTINPKIVKEVADMDNYYAYGHYFNKGDIIYSLNEELHRDDGPALILSNGDQQWWEHGVPHRLDGPAVIHGDSKTEFYFINGDQLEEYEYEVHPEVIKHISYIADKTPAADLATSILKGPRNWDHLIENTLLEISKGRKVTKEQLDYMVLDEDIFLSEDQIELLKKISVRKAKEQELLSYNASLNHDINF